MSPSPDANVTVEIVDGRDPNILGLITIRTDGAVFAGMKISKRELIQFLNATIKALENTDRPVGSGDD